MDAVERLRRLPLGVRRDLLKVLTANERVRADAIGKMWARADTRELADVLIDVESDEVVRLHLIEVIRASL